MNKLFVMIKFFKKHQNLLFLLFFIAFFFLYRFGEITFLKPYSVHQWRQADCYSITTNYYKENLPFLEPEINFSGNKNNGKTISEFPIIYYSVAKLWSIFGQHAFIFRLFNLLILFCGSFCLFKLTTDLFKNPFIGIFISGIAISSPIVSFYGNNFLADVPALSLAYCGWYFFYLFYQTSKNKYIIFSSLIFLLASLIKITSIINPLLILACFGFEFLGIVKLKLGTSKLFTKPLLQIIPFFIIPIVVFFWVQYVKSYNAANNAGIFLTGILPYWEMNPENRLEIIKLFFGNLVPQFHNPFILLITIFSMIFSWINLKKNNPILSIISILG